MEEDDLAANDEDLSDDENAADDVFGMGADETIISESDDEEEQNEPDSESEAESLIEEAEAYESDASMSSIDSESSYQKERKKAYFADANNDAELEDTIDSFQVMNLSRPILKGLAQVGFVKPTPIQARTIPVALLGKDIVGGAVTGSGKTAAFIVPIIERLLYRPRGQASTRVLILCPTRELAIQCHSVATRLATFTDITFCLAVGGLSLKSQELELRNRPDIVIATPGRLIDHIRNAASFSVEACEILVMDEADRMLEDGFAAELNEIVKSCPKGRQTMLFSATMTDNVDELIRLSLNRPVRLMIDPKKATAARLVQEFIRVRQHKEEDRPALLLSLCTKLFRRQCIIFFRSKAAAHQMRILFGLCGLKAGELHGNLSQEQRLASLEAFRDNKVDFLLATDLAARGLDIKGIETVINYNMPQNFAQYLHRVGRTARAGTNGRSVTLVGEADRKLLKMALKHSPAEQVKHRVISAEQATAWRTKIDSLRDDIREVMNEEKEEKALAQAERELSKSSNMIEHADEIYSRPARTWFQNESERKASSKMGTDAHNKLFDNGTKRKAESLGPNAGLNRKQKRNRLAREEMDADRKSSVESIKAIRAAKKSNMPGKLGSAEKAKTGKATVKKKKPMDTKKLAKVGFSSDLADLRKREAPKGGSKGGKIHKKAPKGGKGKPSKGRR